MEIPSAMAEFLEEGIVLDNAMLPQRYAAPDDLAPLQVGFRVDADGRDLVDGAGGWRDEWWVIGLNRFGDPYLVDVTAPELPVTFAYHGAARWQPVPVAEALDDFLDLLIRLQDLEADPRAAVAWLDDHVDADAELWGDVCALYAGDGDRLEERAQVVAGGAEDDVVGYAIVTELGERPGGVLMELERLMDLDPEQTILLAGEPEIAVRHDRLINLRDLIDRLTALGAEVVFDEDE